MSRLLKTTGIILIVLGSISLIVLGIMFLGAVLSFPESVPFFLIALFFDLVVVGWMFSCGIFGIKEDYYKAAKFGKALLTFTLIRFVSNIIFDGFNLMTVFWLIIMGLYVYSTREQGHTANQDSAQQAYTYAPEYQQPYQSQTNPLQQDSSYESRNESNRGFVPLSGNMPDNFSAKNNQNDKQQDYAVNSSSESVKGELSFEEFEKMLNQPSKSEIS